MIVSRIHVAMTYLVQTDTIHSPAHTKPDTQKKVMITMTHVQPALVVAMETVHFMMDLMSVNAKMVSMEQTVRITLTIAPEMINVTATAPASTGLILTIVSVILAFLAETARPTLMIVSIPLDLLEQYARPVLMIATAISV